MGRRGTGQWECLGQVLATNHQRLPLGSMHLRTASTYRRKRAQSQGEHPERQLVQPSDRGASFTNGIVLYRRCVNEVVGSCRHNFKAQFNERC